MLLMIRPAAFAFNAQTAVNNFFQAHSSLEDDAAIHTAALREFDDMVLLLNDAEIDVLVVQDTAQPHTPDSIFPNNWISFHEGGHVIYPMYALNRRLERALDIWQGIPTSKLLLDLSDEEINRRFLEGTGSLVLDRKNRIAYAALSDRTDAHLVHRWCDVMGYEPVTFHALQTVAGERMPIYHTNVMMSVGEDFALWCPACIDNETERNTVEKSLRSSGKELITISELQMHSYAGNILQVFNRKREAFILMSATAEEALQGSSMELLKRHGTILSIAIPTIERFGGGSVRCMVCEISGE